MSTVAHLVVGPTPPIIGATLALIADSIGDRERVILPGAGPLGTVADGVGLNGDRRVEVLLPASWIRIATARRSMRDLGRADALCCWTAEAARMARVAAPKVPRILIATRPPNGGWRGRSRWRGCLGVIAIGSALGAAWRRAGVPDDLITVVEPALDAARITDDRASIRRRLRVGEDCCLVALLDEAPFDSDAMAPMLATGVVYQQLKRDGRPREIRLLVHPLQHRRRVAQDLTERFDSAHVMIQTGGLERPWSVLPACDAAIVCGPPGLGAAWAAAAGAAVIRPRAADEAGADDPAALLIDRGDVRAVSHALAELIDSPDAARAAAAAARRTAAHRHDPAACRRAMRTAVEGMLRRAAPAT